MRPRDGRPQGPRWPRAALVLCLVAALALVGQGSRADGPIPIVNGRPYDLLFLRFAPEGPDVLDRGRVEIGLRLDVANNLLAPAPAGRVQLIEDNEVDRLELSWRKGLGAQTEVAAFVPVVWRSGGFMDPLISGWHRLLGVQGNGPDNPAGRDAFGDYHSVLYQTDASGRPVVSAGNAFGLGDATVALKRELGPSDRRAAVAVRAAVKLPTGNPSSFLGSGAADVGVALDGRYALGREVAVYGTLGGALLGRPTRLPGARHGTREWMVALAYRPNHRDEFVWQVCAGDAPVRTGIAFADGTQGIACFGYRRHVNDRLTVFAAFAENGDIHNYSAPWLCNVGPDFTVSAGVQWRR